MRDKMETELSVYEGPWEFEDGSTFKLTGFAGGSAPGGAFSTVMCELRHADGRVEVIHYVRQDRVCLDQIEETPLPVLAGIKLV